jgi:serine/threonine protein kinase
MAPPSWIGQTLNGRYQIEALLGQGGMSAVYRANDPNLKRVVALKMIHPHLSGDSEFIRRFQEEATAIAALRHPNIIQVYDFNIDSDVHYMVLEFLHGETLFDRLQKLNNAGSTLPVETAIQYGLNICDALTYAHQRGIIHRDIKPANIMINDDNQAILMDFGIVKIVGQTGHTAAGSVVGTPRYIPPEIIRAEQPDQRSDIYSLGITLYEMFSGRTPFQSDSTLTLMMMHLNDPVPDPRTIRQDLPEKIVKILIKTLEKKPENRYQTTADLANDLRKALAPVSNRTLQAPKASLNAALLNSSSPGQPAASKPLTPRPAPQLEPKKKALPWGWLLLASAVLIFFILALGAIGLFWLSRQAIPVNANLPGSTPLQVTPASPQNQNSAKVTPKSNAQTGPTRAVSNYYVNLTGIARRGGQYQVKYETTGFTEQLPWTHIHFFFNTTSPDQAGKSGTGHWVDYDGPRPFTGFAINDTPDGATQVCALVANADHTVILGSGNCLDLPKE